MHGGGKKSGDLGNQTRALSQPVLEAALLLAAGRGIGARLTIEHRRLFGDRRTVEGEPYDFEVHELVGQEGPGFVVSVRRPEPAPPEHVLRQRFSLTRAQVRAAMLLSRRYSDKEIACAMGIALHTARNHVRAVRMKLNVHSRRDVPGLLREIARDSSDSRESLGHK